MAYLQYLAKFLFCELLTRGTYLSLRNTQKKVCKTMFAYSCAAQKEAVGQNNRGLKSCATVPLCCEKCAADCYYNSQNCNRNLVPTSARLHLPNNLLSQLPSTGIIFPHMSTFISDCEQWVRQTVKLELKIKYSTTVHYRGHNPN